MVNIAGDEEGRLQLEIIGETVTERDGDVLKDPYPHSNAHKCPHFTVASESKIYQKPMGQLIFLIGSQLTLGNQSNQSFYFD